MWRLNPFSEHMAPQVGQAIGFRIPRFFFFLRSPFTGDLPIPPRVGMPMPRESLPLTNPQPPHMKQVGLRPPQLQGLLVGKFISLALLHVVCLATGSTRAHLPPHLPWPLDTPPALFLAPARMPL